MTGTLRRIKARRGVFFVCAPWARSDVSGSYRLLLTEAENRINIKIYLAILNGFKIKMRGDQVQARYEQQMKKGVLEMLVLRQLMEEEKYGYQLISELGEKSGGLFVLKEGTIYPILYRMEDDGYVKSHWSEPKGKEISRKYYGITSEGKEALRELTALWKLFSERVSELLQPDGKS